MKLVHQMKPPAIVSYGTMESPIGKLAVGLTPKGHICRIDFMRKGTLSDAVAKWQVEWPQTTFSKGAVVKNLSDHPILMVGTDFQFDVWRVMAKIPSGSVTTYGNIALHIGKSGAARAVGAACGANPVPYLVPCHRVIAANGGLGGFSGGLDIKKKLLQTEGYLPKRA